jgi:hypothetical protein
MNFRIIRASSPVAILSIGLLVLGSGCNFGEDGLMREGDKRSSTIYTLSIDSNNVNGHAYSSATLDLADIHILVVPEGSLLAWDSPAGIARIEIEKTYLRADHPPQRVSIDEKRLQMGCAVKVDEGTCILSTYGSTPEELTRIIHAPSCAIGMNG